MPEYISSQEKIFNQIGLLFLFTQTDMTLSELKTLCAFMEQKHQTTRLIHRGLLMLMLRWKLFGWNLSIRKKRRKIYQLQMAPTAKSWLRLAAWSAVIVKTERLLFGVYTREEPLMVVGTAA